MAEILFGDPFKRFFWTSPRMSRDWLRSTASMDWIETPNSHIYKVDVPGFGKEDVKVELEDGKVLNVRGERSKGEEFQAKEMIKHIEERGGGEFNREIGLPENVKIDQIKCQIDNGVLTIVVPKDTNSKSSKVRNINISSKL